MVNYGFVIDNRKCIGCHACTVACKSEHDVPIGVNRTHVKYIEKGLIPMLLVNSVSTVAIIARILLALLFARPLLYSHAPMASLTSMMIVV